MATDSTASFTFLDPFEEISSTDPLSLFLAENPTLGPSDLPLNDEQIPLSFPDHQPGHQEFNDILDSEDLLLDPYIWAFCNGENDDDDVIGNSGAGLSWFPGEDSSNHNHGINGNYTHPENPVSGDQLVPFSVFSVPRSQYSCICCQTLREITHTNGMYVKRLEIHGRFGVITHAVLGKYDFDSSFPCQDFQMFDFHKESMQIVRKFLVQYFEACKQEGYSTLEDPLSAFYEALCVGLNEADNQNDSVQLSPEETDKKHEMLKLKKPVGCSNQRRFMKNSLALQRKRTRELKLKDFKDFFNLPMEDAAQGMNVCLTVVKKVCRRYGLKRWPHRKIRSIERKISKKRKILETGDSGEKARALEDIRKHEQELANIYDTLINSVPIL